MSYPLLRSFSDTAADMRGKIVAIYALLIAANAAAWAWALIAFHDYPVLLGTCFLAYSFGLRHAVDADHIAAIDNVTRKLMQEGKRPVAAGLFFSLGREDTDKEWCSYAAPRRRFAGRGCTWGCSCVVPSAWVCGLIRRSVGTSTTRP